MELQIYHSVNEGLYLWNGTSGLLIDGLHRGREIGFSDTSEQYICMMRQGRSFFAKPNDLLFTHIHEDHYDQALPREKTGHVLAKMKNFIAPVDEDNAADEELQDIPAEEMCLFEEIAEKAPSDDFHGTENTGGESAFV